MKYIGIDNKTGECWEEDFEDPNITIDQARAKIREWNVCQQNHKNEVRYELLMNDQYKAKALEIITRLRNSCHEGLTELWDCSTHEGREGFSPMIDDCEELAELLGIALSPLNKESI